MVCPSTDGYLYALNPDGSLLWKNHSKSMTANSPVIGESNFVYCATPYCAVWCYDSKGANFWGTGSPMVMNETSVTVPGKAYVSTPWRKLQAITAMDRRLWEITVEANISSPLTLGPNGIIYAVAEKKLHAIRPPAPTPLPMATGAWPMFRANARHTGRVE